MFVNRRESRSKRKLKKPQRVKNKTCTAEEARGSKRVWEVQKIRGGASEDTCRGDAKKG